MEAVVDANTPVDYIEFRIFPSQNRYEACVCYENKKEKVKSGLLEHLLLHSVDIKALQSKGSDDKYKLYPPENLHDNKWFTKSTLIRFLHIIGSEDILEVTNSLRNEISQLEEARRFHLSLYAKGREYQFQNGQSDDSCADDMGSTTEAEDSNASKNELLRAMDLRLNALREELTTAFDQAAGSRYSVGDLTDIEKFSRHLGSTDLSGSLGKHIELRHGAQADEISSITHFSKNDRLKPKERSNHTIKSVCSELPVIYGVSPAKAAQVERQSSTGSDESSFSSEEEQPSAERSRTLIRSASPRRSASPMRRVQIGRSGSRRSTAITIKSLNYFPSRDRMFLPKDSADDSDEEDSEQAPKKPENNARRMSVQDAINLFERKQMDQTVDIQKARSLLSASVGANKSVLRRWSSGMGEDSSQCPQDDVTEGSAAGIQNNVESKEVIYSSQKSEAEQVVASEDFPFENSESDAKLNSPEKEALTPIVMQEETCPTESLDVNEKIVTSAEWSRQKEAELNELLIKMMETKPVKSRIAVPAGSKRQSLPSEQRGGFYDHYKEKRDEKLRGEAPKKREGKDKQLRGMQQVNDAKKSQLSPANADAGRKYNVKKLQKPQISVSQSANLKAESPKLGVVKKASTKASSLPATRKSWPSIPSPGARGPSPGARGSSPAKTPSAQSASGAVPTRRRSQPTPPASQVSSKVETSQTRAKSVKPTQNDRKKTLKPATEKKQQSVTKPEKTVKSNVQTATEENLVSSVKPNLYNKVAKKSSVVPLESKPFLRKGSGNTSSVNLTAKKKASPQEPVRKPEDLMLVDDKLTVSKSSDLVVQHQERQNEEFEVHTSTDSGTSTRSPPRCNDKEDVGEVNPTTADSTGRVEELELKAGVYAEAEVEAEEESTISPTAWVEIEEQDHSMNSVEHSNPMVVSPAYKAPIGASSPRVRHSLSQMLLEESSEPDSIDWGIAENPPAMVYHKDAPKGLKRLLKFARKSKTDANSTGWSSPSVFSEGEDDSEDSRFASKRSAENLLRIATHHSKNNGHQKNFSDYEHSAQASIRKLDAQSLSQQFQEGNVSASMTTTKATRSFFSLSAFKGSK
ncbi:uncharacterized protein LOC130997244 [Salvia miltiorrhiza]|uniref:uncharacterized protein LOC130997244 n=1 Tax=Salvia miltiorrhiza TaxID=226208 RepID=UPI0025AC61F9|nr:uncharacterized protein LOC130997244 [Salvia miltiorrhiza]XP_057778488.1 uncharacterized protein LOC130997244 [Salvia miltiorrhiza]XP_057778489.1 uncharacterized protein LOC130997244 [Salvia miltiorrhiza]